MKRFTKIFLKLGRVKTVLLITAFSIAISVLVTVIILALVNSLQPNHSQLDLGFSVAMSVIVPLIVAPLVSWYLLGLLFRVHQLEQEMRTLATYDALTSLLNRRAFLEQAEFALNIARRDKQDCTIMLADIDWFKKINDQYGHSIGDKVLAKFGEVVRRVHRSSDLAGRIGGEEFAFCLPLTSKREAQVFAERLHKAVRHVVIDTDKNKVDITISIGFVCCPPDVYHTIDTLLDFADIALYQAKNSGRNQTKIASCA